MRVGYLMRAVNLAPRPRIPRPGAPALADIAALQQPDGSFWGDEWGETDTRFSYCALSALWLLDRLKAVDVAAAAAYVAACKNFDGGFGCTPGGWSALLGRMAALVACWVSIVPSFRQLGGSAVARGLPFRNGAPLPWQPCSAPTASQAPRFSSACVPHARCCHAAGNESHAGQAFTCVAALDIAGRLDLVDRDLLCWWCALPAVSCAGFGGCQQCRAGAGLATVSCQWGQRQRQRLPACRIDRAGIAPQLPFYQ